MTITKFSRALHMFTALGSRCGPYPDVSLSMKMCAQRKAGTRQRARRVRLQSVPFSWSLAVHHQSLAFRARLYDAKNEAPEEEARV